MHNFQEKQISITARRLGIITTAICAVLMVMVSLGQTAVMFPLYILMVAFSIYHGSQRYGLKLMLIFTALVTVISWGYETTSILTGFPFGHYHYSETFYGPWVGLVPLMIMPAYFAMGYMSWTMGSILLDKWDSSVKGAELFLLPFVSAVIMVSWDLSFDPVIATVGKSWIWHNGGAYFGVPFANFMGWFLCVFTFYFIYALLLKRNISEQNNVKVTSKIFWILPPLMYVIRTIQYIINALVQESVQVVSNDGHVWWSGDLYWSMLLISIFTMMFHTFYSIVKTSRANELK